MNKLSQLFLLILFTGVASISNAFAYAQSAENAWVELIGEKFSQRVEFAFVKNDANLANVLLYGDSISLKNK